MLYLPVCNHNINKADTFQSRYWRLTLAVYSIFPCQWVQWQFSWRYVTMFLCNLLHIRAQWQKKYFWELWNKVLWKFLGHFFLQTPAHNLFSTYKHLLHSLELESKTIFGYFTCITLIWLIFVFQLRWKFITIMNPAHCPAEALKLRSGEEAKVLLKNKENVLPG